ncbi:MAG TPA: 50S ribosomal protein L17 [Phycisphaerales bacterium]|nr:50S ribosomal protein L17 [Phycisphaerales bacterium]
MRHRKAGYKLNRTSAHRQAMLRNLAASLFEHGQVVTTLPKAKAVQPMVEKIVTKAKRGDLHARRQVIATLGRDRHAFDWRYLPKNADEAEKERHQQMSDSAEQFFDLPPADQTERNRFGEIRKSPRLVRHIFENVAPRFADRQGGYTRIIKLGRHRVGDAAELVLIQFVGAEEGPEIGGRPSTRRRTADKRAAYFDKIKSKVSAPAVATARAAEESGDADTAAEES